MQIVVQVESGSQQGRKFMLRNGQTMQFGRTEWADASFEDDRKMSSKHFSLTAESGCCCLRDLGSSNGTQVNGEFVTEATLVDGDRIQAGDTVLLVAISGGSQFGSEDMPRRQKSAVLDAQRAAAGSPIKPEFVAEPCESGLTRLRGGIMGEPPEPPCPSALLKLLETLAPIYLIVDFFKVENPELRESLTSVVPLFGWLPEELAATASPLIVWRDNCPEIEELVDAAWDNDALVALQSSQNPDELVQHCRRATRMNARGVEVEEDHARAILGYYCPTVLDQLLAFRGSDFVNALLKGVDLALLEVPDLPGTWEAFARDPVAGQIEKLGFRRAEPVTAETPSE